MAKFERDYKIQQMKAFAQVLPELSKLTDADITDIVDSDKAYSIDVETEDGSKRTIRVRPSLDRVNLDMMSIEQEQQYQAIMDTWLEENTEQPFKEGFKKRLDALYESAGMSLGEPISQETKEFLNNLSRQKYMLKQPFYDKNRKFDAIAFAKSSNYQDYMRLQKQKKEMASEWVYMGTNERIRKTGSALKMAQDIKAIDEEWKKELGSRSTSNKVTPEFISMLREVQSTSGSGDALTLLTQSGHLSFSDKFWNREGDDQAATTAGNNVASYEKLGSDIILVSASTNIESTVGDIIDSIKKNKEIIKEIISFNRDASSIGEVSYASFTSMELETVKSCSEK